MWTLLLLAAGYVLLGTLVALLYSFLWYVVMACVCSAAPFVVYYVVFMHRLTAASSRRPSDLFTQRAA